MSDPERELFWDLLPREDGIWLYLYSEEQVAPKSLINLGPKEQVMEAFSQFLAHEDYGEKME